MPKRKLEKDASTTTETAKRERPWLLDLKDVRSRYTGLCVDYTKPCTQGPKRMCHICNDTAAWNGFFVSVGLELQESNFGDLSLIAVRKEINRICYATRKQKAQAATLFHWLLTKHRCVKAVSINKAIFKCHEAIVCSALSSSVGVKTVELLLFPSRALLNNDLLTSLIFMKNLKEVNLVIIADEAFFATLSSAAKVWCSSLNVLRSVDVSMPFLGELGVLLENEGLCFTSITARVVPRLLARSRKDFGSVAFTWRASQSLTTLKVTATKRGPRLDVRAICEALSAHPLLTQLDLEPSTLKKEHAAPIRRMLGRANTLQSFGLTYTEAEKYYREPFTKLDQDSSVPHYDCLRCHKIHVTETRRIKPWIEALLQASRSVSELRFPLFAFCTLECRAFLGALAKNSTLKKVTIPILGQIPSEYCKFLNMTGVAHRISTDVACTTAYPEVMEEWRPRPGQLPKVSFRDLKRALFDASTRQLITHVQLRVYSFLCLTKATDAAAIPLVRLIRKAPFLSSVAILVDSYCCSDCWNSGAPALCNAVLRNTGIGSLEISLPNKKEMDLLPLADMLQRSPGLYRFKLKPPSYWVLVPFLCEFSKPKIWENYNLTFVDLTGCQQGQLKEKLIIQNVVDRNFNLAVRAARFVVGMRYKDDAEALEVVSSSPFLLKKVCDSLRVNKNQALNRVRACLKDIADMNGFMRLTGVVHRKLVCNESVDGSTQLSDLNEYCLRHIRQYLKLSDVEDSPS
ncbi:hypothetical protein HPB50_020051 [Hyalomma asiaticum]|uniref:Uncharacterized protein n=1 Tax=Hyalomma asiaticum TaxID=266040 RepID=A0ACB7RQX0_HYAAI|nr:hypothetical protein HPB50_020051 [Hyalomma asiaticum]